MRYARSHSAARSADAGIGTALSFISLSSTTNDDAGLRQEGRGLSLGHHLVVVDARWRMRVRVLDTVHDAAPVPRRRTWLPAGQIDVPRAIVSLVRHVDLEQWFQPIVLSSRKPFG